MEQIIELCKYLEMDFYEGCKGYIKCYNYDKSQSFTYSFEYKYLLYVVKTYHKVLKMSTTKEDLLDNVELEKAIDYLKQLQ